MRIGLTLLGAWAFLTAIFWARLLYVVFNPHSEIRMFEGSVLAFFAIALPTTVLIIGTAIFFITVAIFDNARSRQTKRDQS
jgi:hypothetical protein